jgi:hypothetical protein
MVRDGGIPANDLYALGTCGGVIGIAVISLNRTVRAFDPPLRASLIAFSVPIIEPRRRP